MMRTATKRFGLPLAFCFAVVSTVAAGQEWLQMKYDDLNEAETTAPAAPAAAEG